MGDDPGRLRAGCDEAEGETWTVAADATVVRAHQHSAGTRHAPPKDIDPARLAVAELSAPARRGAPPNDKTPPAGRPVRVLSWHAARRFPRGMLRA